MSLSPKYNFKNTITSGEIISFRKSLSLSQADFANLLGVSKPTVERLEHSDKTINGVIAVFINTCLEKPELVEERIIPDKKYPLRLWYMYKDRRCTLIDVDEMNRKIFIRNYVSNIMLCAFGANQKPNYDDYEEFLKSRCFPETRDKIKIELSALDIPFYDPMLIIEKTEGRMAEDDFWIKIER